ncbi:MAG: sulfatase-like hydrolase/transferase [Leptothrix ochracea]|uniref:sulfatase-like hydrolase/transferase n=1 Tax=Leptothrix ochracea TaxID=735331 RepID=UPI0034E1B2FC
MQSLTPSRLIWLFTVVNLLAFHLPLLSYLRSTVALDSTLGLGVMVILVCLSTMLMWLVLGGVSLLSPRLIKPLALLFTLVNGLALYAMNSYHVVLDQEMISNVWNTNTAEATALFHPKLLVYLALAGGLPAWLAWKLPLAAEGRLRRSIHLGLTWVVGGLVVFSQSSAWLWIDQNAKVVGGLMLPWSYVINSTRHLSEQHDAHRQLEPLPPIAWQSPSATAKPVTVVLVIGESARAANFSLYGYARETNPKLKQRQAQSPAQLQVLPLAQSCATYTTRSLECILAHQPQAASITHEVLPAYLSRSGHVDVVWRSRNWGEPPMSGVNVIRGDALAALCVAPQCTRPDLDDSLIAGLEQDMARAGPKRQLIVLHQAGSHGPEYHKKYPADFAKFLPTCDSVDLKACSADALVNAYDNSVAYTDDLLDRLISTLERQTERRTVLIYLSDHGESLGEGGWYLHGAPDMLAPKVQKEIPFLVWMSPAFAQDFRVKPERLNSTTPNTQGRIFHSVLGALGGRSPAYLAEQDIFEAQGSRP